MDEGSRGPGNEPRESLPAILLTYRCAEDVRSDRVPGDPRGLIARSGASLLPGDMVDVRIEVARERTRVAARGLVRWATPLAAGSLVGLELQGVGHRDAVKLDLLLGVRVAGTVPEHAIEAPADARPLSVTMLQPNGVLRQVLQNALERFAKEKAGGAALRLEAVADVPTFVAAVSARHPELAIIDCDGIAEWVDPILEAVRSHERASRVILLSSAPSARAEDRYTVTMRKPVGMRAFLDTADLLLRG